MSNVKPQNGSKVPGKVTWSGFIQIKAWHIEHVAFFSLKL